MNLLGIDTSTKNLSMAVARDGKVLAYRNVKLTRPLDLSIMPAIERILRRAGLTVGQLDGFAVGLGPGSFTSLRVGLAAVKGLAFGTGKPVIGVPSLDILAMNVKGDGQVCALSDAKRDLVYACIYEKKGQALKIKSRYLLAGLEDVLGRLKGEVTFVGDGIDLYAPQIKRAKGIVPEFADAKDSYPQARRLVPLALERVRAKKWDHVDKLVPLYLYPDHCQIRTNQK